MVENSVELQFSMDDLEELEPTEGKADNDERRDRKNQSSEYKP